MTWALGRWPDDVQLNAWARHALQTANTIPARRWVDDCRPDLRDSLSRAQARLLWDQLQVQNRQIQIRQPECAAAVADLTEPAVAAIARRLLGTWTGSAEALIPAAHAVSSQRKE